MFMSRRLRTILLLAACHLLAIAVSAHSSDYQPKLLPATAQTMRQKYKVEMLEFQRDTLARDYEVQGAKDAKWDAQAISYLEQCAMAWSGKASIPAAQSIEAGKRVLALGCDDPVVGYCLGHAFQDAERFAEALPIYAGASKSFRSHPYSAYRRAQCSIRIMECHLEIYGPLVDRFPPDVSRDSNEHYRFALETGVAALTEDCFKGRERLLYNEVSNYFPTYPSSQGEMLRRLATFADRPGFDPWLQDLLIGANELDVAWKKRGSRWNQAPTPEQTQNLNEHLALVRRRLTVAYDMHPEFPFAAAEMIEVSMAERSREERMWLDRAVAADFECGRAYKNYLFSLAPMWGGGKEKILAFGEECLATKRFDTQVPYQYLEAWRTVFLYSENRLNDDKHWMLASFRSSERNYRNMLDLWQGYIDYANSHDAAKLDWYESMRVATAYAYGDRASAGRWRKEMKGHFFASSLEVFRFNYDDNTAAIDDIEELARQPDPGGR
jgi:hypothetical protein